MKHRIVCTLLLLLVLSLNYVVATPRAYACSCSFPDTAQQALDGADVVFYGKVSSVTDATPTGVEYSPTFPSSVDRAVLFDVVTIWKGEVGEQQVVYTGSGAFDCSVRFTVGETVVVYAGRYPEGPLVTFSCMYWRPKNWQPVMLAFGPGKPPPRSPSQDTPVEMTGQSQPEQSGLSDLYLVGSLLALISVLGLALLIHRRRSTSS